MSRAPMAAICPNCKVGDVFMCAVGDEYAFALHAEQAHGIKSHCNTHPKYSGARKPSGDCAGCWIIHRVRTAMKAAKVAA